MATEEQKKRNQMRLIELTLLGLTTAVWDMVGESAYAFSQGIGENILQVMEKEMGLEIAGESPEDIAEEVTRIFIDEFGIAEEIENSAEGNVLTQKIKNYIGRQWEEKLAAAGVEQPFTSTFMCVGQAVARRQGKKVRVKARVWEEGNGMIITWEVLD